MTLEKKRLMTMIEANRSLLEEQTKLLEDKIEKKMVKVLKDQKQEKVQ